jgi:hypothetical protein
MILAARKGGTKFGLQPFQNHFFGEADDGTANARIDFAVLTTGVKYLKP